MAKKRIAILGGGMASLAAAFELSSRADWKNEFEITIYQMGWRLGGKCASSRAEHEVDGKCMRIEEHALHVWFGFYHNAFGMMRRCYAELGLAPYSVDKMFRRRSSTPLMEHIDDKWQVWPLDFPEDADDVEPAINRLPTLAQYIGRLFRFISRRFGLLARSSAEWSNPEGEVGLWLRRVTKGVPLSTYRADELSEDMVTMETLFRSAEKSSMAESTARSVTRVLNADELAFLDELLAGPERLMWNAARDNIDSISITGLRDKARRTWILTDLVLATLRGLARDPRVFRGLSALDGDDFRKWLSAYGASKESVNSAPVRAFYDLCFSYRDGDSSTFASADFAAGTALRCLMNITMGYSGAVCYVMNAGMGEAVVGPLYEVLRKRGVCFEFFHRVEALELDAAAPEVSAIRFVRQAQLRAPYRPVSLTVDGLLAWPAAPNTDQLVDGDRLQGSGVDFESDWSEPWRLEETYTLARGAEEGFDVAVLGISLAELPRVTSELTERYPKWRRMLEKVLTVQTQSAQLWLTKTLAQIGYEDPAHPPSMIAAPEPMDVWSDMSHVIARETWPAANMPKSVHYICGPLAGDFQGSENPPRAASEAVRATTEGWLATMSAGAWKGLLLPAGGIDWNAFVAPAGATGADRLDRQHLKANINRSERYVLSVAGSTEHRMKPDGSPLKNLFLAGDWTLNGLDAGCVEAAVLSGIQAARAIRGERIDSLSGAHDLLGTASEKFQATVEVTRRFGQI